MRSPEQFTYCCSRQGENVKNHNRSSSADLSSFTFRKRPNLGDHVIGALTGAVRRVFHTTRLRTIILGISPSTRVVAAELYAAGESISLVDLTRERKSEDEGAPFVIATNEATSDEAVFTQAGAQSAKCVVAATPDDDRNLSLCRTALEIFRVPVVIARLRLIDEVTSWARVNESGMLRLSWRDLIQTLVPDQVLSPALSRLGTTTDREQIVEIEVRTPVHMGRKIADVPLYDCQVLALTRAGSSIADFDSVELQLNDVLTLVGTKPALTSVRAALASL
jgi:Trk K+ transport system NAD-binding subunit